SIVGAASNKVLLIHGRSGAGKSSFLRAGLIPRLEEAGFIMLRLATAEDPHLIRCTADPVTQIRPAPPLPLPPETVNGFPPRELCAKAAELLLPPPPDDSSDTSERILDTFEVLSHGLVAPLAIIIDQAEEILTLNSDKEQQIEQRAFFYLLEELCIRNL